jgi:hypothetical protein
MSADTPYRRDFRFLREGVGQYLVPASEMQRLWKSVRPPPFRRPGVAMNTIKPTLALLFALATVTLVGGCRRPTAEDAVQPDARATALVHRAQAAAPAAKAAAAEVMTAQTLVQDFANDPAASAGRFADRAVVVTGEVGNLEAGDDGAPVLTLKGATGSAAPRFILDADAWPDISTLRAGAKVSLSCRGASGAAGQVTVNACDLLQRRGDTDHRLAKES